MESMENENVAQAIREQTEAIKQLTAAVRLQNELIKTAMDAIRSRTGIW